MQRKRCLFICTIINFIGITLVEVPYWWDRKLSSLAATVYNIRPDLFTEQPQGNPIPLSPPTKSESLEQGNKHYNINNILLIYICSTVIKGVSYDSD